MKVYILSEYCNFESYGNSARTILGVYKHIEDAEERMIKAKAKTYEDVYFGHCYYFHIEEYEVIP